MDIFANPSFMIASDCYKELWGGKRNKKHEDILGDYTMYDYVNRMSLIALSVYEWQGLTEDMPEFFIEKQLMTNGMCIAFYCESIGHVIVTRATVSGIDWFNRPASYKPVISSSIPIDLPNIIDKDNCVLIPNNKILTPTLATIQLFASRLAERERTIDVNMSVQKTPYIITVPEEQKAAINIILEKLRNGSSEIVGVKALDKFVESIKVLDLKAPYVADKIRTDQQILWNQFLSFLGVDNANTSKKERLIVNEVDSNNEMTDISGFAMLESRQKAAKEINEKFGEYLDEEISVDFRRNNSLSDITEERREEK